LDEEGIKLIIASKELDKDLILKNGFFRKKVILERKE